MEKSSLSERERLVVGALPRDRAAATGWIPPASTGRAGYLAAGAWKRKGETRRAEVCTATRGSGSVALPQEIP